MVLSNNLAFPHFSIYSNHWHPLTGILKCFDERTLFYILLSLFREIFPEVPYSTIFYFIYYVQIFLRSKTGARARRLAHTERNTEIYVLYRRRDCRYGDHPRSIRIRHAIRPQYCPWSIPSHDHCNQCFWWVWSEETRSQQYYQ